MGAVYLLLYRTRFGRSVRATMQDQTAARLVGIDVNRVAALTFGIGVAVTAAGGMAFGMTNAFNPNSGYDLISRLLSIIILGGMGSVGGALGASLFMLTLESVVSIWQPQWAVAVYYAALVIVLLYRPTGLFGQTDEGALVPCDPPDDGEEKEAADRSRRPDAERKRPARPVDRRAGVRAFGSLSRHPTSQSLPGARGTHAPWEEIEIPIVH